MPPVCIISLRAAEATKSLLFAHAALLGSLRPNAIFYEACFKNSISENGGMML
jgi:hypothetical protein